MIRKFKRMMLKKELGTNEIQEEFHKRYGHKPNITKLDIKLKTRKEKTKRKARRKLKKKKENEYESKKSI